ncbi:histidine kinase [Myxococcus fulvus 124B02]|nr:histidine kinase [Myxococcus fulvus 124B02]
MHPNGGGQTRNQGMARALAWGAAMVVLLLGLATLTGWLLSARPLFPEGDSRPATAPRTSLALVLGGLALALRSSPRPSLSRRRLSALCAAGMWLIGCVSAAQDVMPPLGPLDALIAQASGVLDLRIRPSPLTALCLLLLGTAMLLPERKGPRPSWSDALVMAAVLVALLGFNGLLLGPLVGAAGETFPAQRSMGLYTSIAVLLLGVGVPCSRPERGLAERLTRDTLGGFLARRMVPLALLGPTLLGACLALLHLAGLLGHEAKLPLFATLLSAGGAVLVLLVARALELLEAGQRRATAALAASEARYRSLLETTPEPLLMVDASGRMRFVNAEAERVFGHPREALLGHGVEVLVPEGLFGGQRLDGDSTARALRGQRADGTPVALEARLRNVHGPEGPSLLVVLRDVTEREQATARLQAAREEAELQRGLVQAVLNHAPVGVLFTDPTRDSLLMANPFAQTMLGPMPEHPRRGAYLDRLRHPDGRPLTMEDLPSTRATRTGEVVGPEELLITRPDGGTTPVLITAAPVFGPQGEPRGVVVTGQDLTTRHELERLREEYVSLISHDLRNPLQGITLRASLLTHALKERGMAREEALTEAILRNVAWMKSMIEELLEGSRLESRGVELRREPTDVVRFLEGVLERDVPPDLRERFLLEVATPVPLAWVDAARLERVLTNLLGNAAKYSPAGRPIHVRVSTSPEDHVVVAIRDEGPGLAREDAEHVFDKYFRTRQGSASDTQGLGLGLYISRLIIEAHGGRIWVESEPGQGSTFCFSLPTTPQGPEPHPPEEEMGPKGLEE